jgi:hypothetical protein
MEIWYLIDAQTEDDAVKLRFYDATTREVREVKDSKYRPYFLVPYPLSEKDEYTVNRIFGKVSEIKKRDLFSDETRTLAKIETKNPNNIQRFSKMFENVWESEIEFSRGYVYDHGMVFGSQYQRKENRFVAVSGVPREKKTEFKRKFAEIKINDPLKYDLLENFLTYATSQYLR